MSEEELKDIPEEQETGALEIPEDNSGESAEMPLDEQATEAGSRYSQIPYWRKVVAVLVIFVILVLIFLGVRALYHHYHKSGYRAPAGTNGQAPKQPDGKSSGGAVGSGSGSKKSGNGVVVVPGGNGSGANGAGGVGILPLGSGSSTGKNGSGSPKQLANTGPGDVLAVFTGTSLAAAGVHYVITNRRSKKD